MPLLFPASASAAAHTKRLNSSPLHHLAFPFHPAPHSPLRPGTRIPSHLSPPSPGQISRGLPPPRNPKPRRARAGGDPPPQLSVFIVSTILRECCFSMIIQVKKSFHCLLRSFGKNSSWDMKTDTQYTYASREKTVHASPIFAGRDIRSEKVVWGTVTMIDAERRLLANALQDADNQHFVLLSESCVPLHNFDYVYSYLMETNISFVDSFDDPGPHGAGRYSEHMLPEIAKRDWRKGAQWFTVKRQHAVLILVDTLYYGKFKRYCKPGNEYHNCYSDEHYLPTLFNMVDPTGIANWSVTRVDWSEGKWHPKVYRAVDTSFELLKSIASIDESIHVTSNAKHEMQRRPCMWNGMKRPCYLFARKFYPEALDTLMNIFSNFTVI
ncbi:hypothetical protein ZWY2020_001749 [Hordeum vulgare]|nr:hypothetical protein ZWY2020_001749 [Hordeum vulgare]